MLEWHKKFQNPRTAGFDSFTSPSYKHHLEALAGAVHNFHLHLYLGENYGYEYQIIPWVEMFLYQGRLTACQSIDFVELAVRSIPFAEEPQKLANALIFHTEALLNSQQSDGGWLEDNNDIPTTAAGFKDTHPSSCSYATWFRLASLGMVAITILGDSPDNWGFRKTLGMGYAPHNFPDFSKTVQIRPATLFTRTNKFISDIPRKAKTTLIKVGMKLVNE